MLFYNSDVRLSPKSDYFLFLGIFQKKIVNFYNLIDRKRFIEFSKGN